MMAKQVQRHKLPGEYKYDGIVYMTGYRKELLDRVKYRFQLRDNDVIVATYPKSGTTWFQEIVWLLMNNADISRAKSILQDTRVPYLEHETPRGLQAIDILEQTDSPRIIKTHLPFEFFSKQLTTKRTKLILGVRNVKDTLVSYYHFYRMNSRFGNMTGPFDEFFELFRDKHLAFGDWFDHNLGYWNNREKFNIFLLKYEDVQKDFYGNVRKLANFLGKELSEEQFGEIAKFVEFNQMKNNDMVNKSHITTMKHEVSSFMRKGKVGDWKNYLTDEQNEYIDKLCKEKIEGTGLECDFEIP